MQFIGDDDEIPMREGDELWKHNSFGDGDEIPMWNRDKYGNAMRICIYGGIPMGKQTNIQQR